MEKQSNPRRFRAWDTGTLKDSVNDATEIKHSLEQICAKENATIENIKPALVSAKTLYMLANCYLHAYEALVTEDLIHTGNSNKYSQTLH